MSIECDFVQEFDGKKMLQYVNKETSVLHCHHYATLFTKLAFDLEKIGGTTLLREAAEESMYVVLQKYFVSKDVYDRNEKIAVAEQYCGLCGLGQLELNVYGSGGGSAKMRHSHVDEGWIKKWQEHKKPVNFIGQGYILAAFAIINDESIGSYEITETKSIVKGDSYSEFTIEKA